MVDNDLICERLVMGSLNNAVSKKKKLKFYGTICYKFSAFFCGRFCIGSADFVTGGSGCLISV